MFELSYVLNQKMQIDLLLYTDYSKAFNIILHRKFLNQLDAAYNVNGLLLK